MRTIIQEHSTALVKGLMNKINSLKALEHRLTKGELKEHFISDLLVQFIPQHLGIGSGIIINQKGEQSKQCDIVIYDNRILPPFIRNANLGLYPIESVVGTIEIKSKLTSYGLLKFKNDCDYLMQVINDPSKRNDKKSYVFKIINGIVGFEKSGLQEFEDPINGASLLKSEYSNINGICIPSYYSWFRIGPNWKYEQGDTDTYEETKRFIAQMVDRVRMYSFQRINAIGDNYEPWTGIYIRK